jgi:uncharacterized membrane protein
MLAAAVAALFALSAEASAPAKDAKTNAAAIKCSGVNECKGKSACAGAGNACAGKNECKGKGVTKMTEADCKAKGGTVVAAK